LSNRYLEKHAVYGPLIPVPANEQLFLSVVIPCYNEPDLLRTLNSLRNCIPTRFPAEVIVVFNASKDNSEAILRNEKSEKEFDKWESKNRSDHIRFFKIVKNDLETKHAGVGLARKIGMDEAVRRFESIKNHEGVIVCLDADCTVSRNYLREIEQFFIAEPKATGCSIYFEHPVEGNEFEEEVYRAITAYELYLRYYHAGLKWSGYPYCFQTIGSCMAVRSHRYQKAGGMNRRKAGEDFYFLHKIFPAGNFFELNTTCVYPSPRPSLRVPFGTGSTVHKVISRNHQIKAFNLQSFTDLKAMNALAGQLYDFDYREWIKSLPLSVKKFFEIQKAEEKIGEIKANAASNSTFIKRFYTWFDGLLLLQYFHFCRDYFYPDEPLEKSSTALISRIYNKALPEDEKQALLFFREQALADVKPVQPC
jgi:glycosyltransferase involved in cell wall biosynthesis